MPSGVLFSAMYNSAMSTRLTTCLVLALVIAGCRSRDVEKDLAITDVHTGWYDVGIVNGQNKLVPSISLKLKNVSPEQISRVQINAVFKRLDGENKEWDAHFVRGIGPDGLAPGAKGDELVLRSDRGYTGTEPRLQMLQNKAFIDAKVEIFGKHGSNLWVKLAEFTIDRQLLTE